MNVLVIVVAVLMSLVGIVLAGLFSQRWKAGFTVWVLMSLMLVIMPAWSVMLVTLPIHDEGEGAGRMLSAWLILVGTAAIYVVVGFSVGYRPRRIDQKK